MENEPEDSPSTDEEDVRDISEIISQEAVDMPESVGKLLPKGAASILNTELEKRKKGFALPKAILDELFDFTPDESKNRAYTYTRKLNRQYPQKDTKLVWRIGVNGTKFYTIDIVEKTTIKPRGKKPKK